MRIFSLILALLTSLTLFADTTSNIPNKFKLSGSILELMTHRVLSSRELVIYKPKESSSPISEMRIWTGMEAENIDQEILTKLSENDNTLSTERRHKDDNIQLKLISTYPKNKNEDPSGLYHSLFLWDDTKKTHQDNIFILIRFDANSTHTREVMKNLESILPLTTFDIESRCLNFGESKICFSAQNEKGEASADDSFGFMSSLNSAWGYGAGIVTSVGGFIAWAHSTIYTSTCQCPDQKSCCGKPTIKEVVASTSIIVVTVAACLGLTLKHKPKTH